MSGPTITYRAAALCWYKIWERCWVDVMVYSPDHIEFSYYDTQFGWYLP